MWSHPGSGVVGRARDSRDEPLTLHVASNPGACEGSLAPELGARQAFAAFSSRTAASTNRNVFHRQVPPRLLETRLPATDLAVLPPRSGVLTLFHPSAATHEGLDSTAAPAVFPLGNDGPCAACRLLPSIRTTSTTTDLPNSAEPHQRMPVDAATSKRDLSVVRIELRMAAPLQAQPVEMSWARGHAPDEQHAALATAIARGGDFAPTLSSRTPHVAARAGARVGEPASVGVTLLERAALHALPASLRCSGLACRRDLLAPAGCEKHCCATHIVGRRSSQS